MELFSAAGIDLPKTDAKGRGRSIGRRLHTPLFNYRVVQDAVVRAKLTELNDRRDIAADYARKIKQPAFLKQKEVAVRGMLVRDLLHRLLGYTPYDPAGHDMAEEYGVGRGAVDVALGRFARAGAADELVAPFELKGPDSVDLDRIMPGRGRSPVQQAWDYAIDSPGARWVLVSNCLEIRLYAFGRGRDAFERFDLTRLDETFEQDRLWQILGAERFLGGATEALLQQSDSAYRDVTNELYSQYAGLRRRLIDFLRDAAGGPALPTLQAVEIAQKLLDRVLFIAFAQRTDLMADRLLERAAKTRNSFAPQPLWNNFLGLFRAVDQGDAGLEVPAYNGGLFSHDPVADRIAIPDHLAEEIAGLGAWDYRREVPVTVLGRLFEQSITDLEALKSGEPPPVSKRKLQGVVYTPDMVTRFLVERTVALSLDERRAALWARHGMEGEALAPEAQAAFWRAYLEVLRGFTIVDPACGSGAFLVAAFDEMARRYRDVATALEALDQPVDFDAFDEIVTKNLYGVDLNGESVEITRLSLWLKTARRNHRLQDLEATIKEGDSLLDVSVDGRRPFDWRAGFAQVFESGGFDVVLGNPPYVRMEHLKSIKPYLAQHYAVADDRTDLYAYFFERGVQVLKAGGRLGYISSSTFFKTGSGANLRTFLSDGVAIEAVVDFGDVQVFEGVTTYPAILTLQKTGGDGHAGDLTFLAVKDAVPSDLGRPFLRDGQAMPRARLGQGSWQFEGDALAALRAKITTGRRTLGEVYGPPMRGIVTGLNKAFVIDRPTRDRLVTADPTSAELLKPFLRGENIKRWRVESEDLFLINTPKGKVDIEAYPAVKAWLAPFKAELEARATQQAWWELQQAQLAYQGRLGQSKIVWPHFQDRCSFSLDESGAFLNNKCFFYPTNESGLLCLLNSRAFWFQLVTSARLKRGGYIEAEAQYVGALSVPEIGPEDHACFRRLARTASTAAGERLVIERAVQRRILDLAPPERGALSGRLAAWPALDFKAFLAEVKRAFRVEIPLNARGEWEDYLAETRAQVNALTARIAAAEREIDALVYGLFDLTPAEIALLESSLAGQY